MLSWNEKSAQAQEHSLDSIELKHSQTLEMDTQEKELSSSEVNHQSRNAQIKLATEAILGQFKELCVLLAE